MTKSAFHQLLDDPKKARTLAAKADLMIAIEQLIKRNGLNNTQAAKLLGTPRSRISELMNGKIDRISLDSLNIWLDKLSNGQLRLAVVPTKDAVNPASAVASIG